MGYETDLDKLEQEEELELEDRGDDVDPELPDDDDLDLSDQDDDNAGDDQDAKDDDVDPDDLRDLAGEDEDKPRMIPHARFNEVNEQFKAEREARLRLEEELARAKGGKEAASDDENDAGADKPEPFDFKAKRRELRQAIYEGDDDRADALEDEIEQARLAEAARIAEEKAESRYQARAQEEQRKALDAQQAQIQKAAEEVTEAYPFLDEGSDQFDRKALVRATAYRDMYIRDEGKEPAEAIRLAAKDVAEELGLAESGENPGRKPKADAKLSAEQLAEGVRRSERIPPRDAGIGERSQKVDYSQLTEDEFESLPDAEKRKARGDYVA